MAAFQIIDQVLEWHACSSKNRHPTQDFGIRHDYVSGISHWQPPIVSLPSLSILSFQEPAMHSVANYSGPTGISPGGSARETPETARQSLRASATVNAPCQTVPLKTTP